MKTIRFEGKRVPNGENIVRVIIENEFLGQPVTEIFNLPLYLDEVNHSPTGFEWGYGGSGPAQLAYAILRCFFRNREGLEEKDAKDWAMENYQDFKWYAISKISGDTWELHEVIIRNWINKRLK